MSVTRTLTGAGLMLGILAAIPACSAGSIADRIEREARERMDRNVEEAVEGGADRTEEGIRDAVRCVVGDDACIERAEAEGREVVLTDEGGDAVAGADGGSARPGEGVWANYDFVPGDRVLFAADFTSANVGDFPRRLGFVEGNMEVVEWRGGRALRFNGAGHFTVPLPERLPERFTIEAEVHHAHGNQTTWIVPGEVGDGFGSYEGSAVKVDQRGSGVAARRGAGGEAVTDLERETFTGGFAPVRVMVDGAYAKVYVGGQRVANVPNAVLHRSDAVHFFTAWADPENPVYVRDIRIAAGGRDLYDALSAEGRVSTRGIYFATGSDRIRPESTPTLGEIGEMLQRHPDLRLTIEGHTDSRGEDAANRALSERRAQAVKRLLVEEFMIDAARLTAVGKGESEPAAGNDTPEGRRQNRRVELVRQ